VTWGLGSYGISPWGTGVVAPPPGLAAVSSPHGGPGPLGGQIVEVRGGTVITIAGMDFFGPVLIEVLEGAGPPFNVVGKCFVWDYEFDLKNNRIFAGTPALPAGLYSLRVTTDGGVSPVLLDCLEYVPFAEEMKVQRVRRSFAPVWKTGPRVLVTNEFGG